MTVRSWSAFLTLPLIAVALMSAPVAHPQSTPRLDEQLWSEVDATLRISDRIALTATLVDREGEALPNPTLRGAGVTADLRVWSQWTVGGGVYEVQTRSTSTGSRANVTLPVVYLTGDWSVAGFHVSDRNRFEQLMGAPGDPWRYRNRLMVDHPLHFALPIRSMFVSDEIFYDFSRNRLTRNRAQAGVTFAPVGPVSSQVYVMRQDDPLARLRALNILGFSLKIGIN